MSLFDTKGYTVIQEWLASNGNQPFIFQEETWQHIVNSEFGPLKDVIPYLMRRAQENSSVSGHTGRELQLIKNELKRRRVNSR